jgi:hypothetical protein
MAERSVMVDKPRQTKRGKESLTTKNDPFTMTFDRDRCVLFSIEITYEHLEEIICLMLHIYIVIMDM